MSSYDTWHNLLSGISLVTSKRRARSTPQTSSLLNNVFGAFFTRYAEKHLYFGSFCLQVLQVPPGCLLGASWVLPGCQPAS